MKTISFRGKLFLNALKKTKNGTLQIALPDGSIESFGCGAPTIPISIKSWSAFNHLLNKGDIGLAEKIILQEIEVKEIPKFIQWICENENEIKSAFYGRWIATLFNRLIHILRPNSRRGAKRNIVAHYDIGNEFYKLWLDPSMSYSAGIFSEQTTSLEDAQQAKYDRIIDMLDIKSSDKILEIGCGWGGFFQRAIQRTGCHVTAILNSNAQEKYCSEIRKSKNLENNLTICNMDYRDIKGTFDKIVSIEMIEAVGEKFWPVYFGKLSENLITGGKAMIQAITIREDLFPQYRQTPDFIQQYVFPGGMLLTNSIMRQQGKNAGLNLCHTFEFGTDYAETLKHWQTRFFSHLEDIKKMGLEDRLIRLWEVYLGYCEGAFRAKRINVGQYLYQKN